MVSRHWEREGMPSFPCELEIDYCLMIGEDLRDDPQAWEATGKHIETNTTKLVRIAQMIFDKAAELT